MTTAGKIMTVRGAIEPSELGFTSMHEHVLVDLAECYRARFTRGLPGMREFPDGPFSLERRSELRHAMLLSSENLRLDDEEAATGEVADFAAAGGSAIVETGAPGIRSAEEVAAFRRISERAGVHIVACTGLYAEDSWPERFRGLSEDEYADYLRGEIADGIGDSGILPGQIKVAYEGRSEDADAYLRAAAKVSRESGLSLQVHVGLMLSNEEMRSSFLPLLYGSECVPERTVICHVENWMGTLRVQELVKEPRSVPRDLSLHREVLDRGFNINFTLFGAEWDTEALGLVHRPDWFYMAGMLPLIKDGYAGQIVMGHDVFTKSQTRRGGGEGFTRIPRSVVPTLRRCGVSQEDLQRMTVGNPARILAVVR
jgi:phosphotriesterase-related protein